MEKFDNDNAGCSQLIYGKSNLAEYRFQQIIYSIGNYQDVRHILNWLIVAKEMT